MRISATLVFFTVALATLTPIASNAALDYAVKLQTGDMQPQPLTDLAAKSGGFAGKYVLIQFDEQMSMQDRDRLATHGILILDYVPNNTWIARIEHPLSQSDVTGAGVRWLDAIRPDQKISPDITQLGIRESAKRPNGRAVFAVIMQRDQNLAVWSGRFTSDYGAEILGTEPSVNKIDLILPENAYLQLAQLDEVQWIEQGPPPKEETNNSSRVNIGASVVQAAPYNLTGQGITVAEWDGGRAKGDHPDLTGRVIELDESSYQVHATHVAGTIIGDGTASSGLYKGMAPQARLVTQQWWNNASQAASEYTTVTNSLNARCANNSWGYGITPPATDAQCSNLLGNYYSEDATLDNIVRGDIGKPITIMYSAGNQRGSSSSYCGSIGWTYNTIDPLASSKNVVTVGAINSNNSTMTSFSSWGPTDDGRIKPDIVGPGCQSNDDYGVTSCNTTGGYATMCGTSMSGPAVTGVVALLYQQQAIKFPSTPILSSTIKGILCNTAIDLGATGPDYQYGWGKVDAVKAATKIGIGAPSYVESQVSTGETQSYDLTVQGGTQSLKVTIAWDDKGGTSSTSQALINDLDLLLVDPIGGEHQVWTLDGQNPTNPATLGVDHLNNVEMAEVTSPMPGIWKARVTGYNVPFGPQKYSIVFTPDSINTPGASRAYAAFDGGDQTRNPGEATSFDFWVTNTGGIADSARIRITDDVSWLTTPVDTLVYLPPQDSAHLVVSATVPAQALAGQRSAIICRVNSIIDTTVQSQNTAYLNAAAIYGLHSTSPVAVTASSPQNLPLSVRVRNTGNGSSSVTVTPVSRRGWLFTPVSRTATIGARDSSDLAFTVAVPAEVPDQAQDTIAFVTSGSGGASDSSSTTVLVNNPVFPPALLAPDTALYSQNRVYSFTWSGTADSYRLLIATDSGFTNVVRSYPGIAATSFSMPAADSLPDNRYYWGVRKYVGADSSSLQLHARKIVVDTKAPTEISTISPANGSILVQKYVSFSFSQATQPGATEAPEFSILQIASDPGFTTGLREYSNITGTGFLTPDTLPEGRSYWRVQRSDLAGNVSNPSSAPSFIMDTHAPDLATLLSPANNSTVKNAPFYLKWTTGTPPPYETSREYYYVHVAKSVDFSNTVFGGYIYADSMKLDTPLLVPSQQFFWRVKSIDSAGFYTSFTVGSAFFYQPFRCGDVNGSGGVPDGTDLANLVAYLTTGAPVPPVKAAASLNCDVTVDSADLAALVAYLTGTLTTLCCP